MSELKIAIQNSLSSFKEEEELQMCLLASKQVNCYEFSAKQASEKEVRGDGNCLFRCIAIEMYGDEKHHALVRQSMINFVRERKVTFQSSANLEGSIDAWIGKMANCGSEEFGLMGEFGDSFSLELLSWMLERPIVVSMRDCLSDKLLHTDIMGGWFTKPEITLVLRGQHYNLLA